MIDFRGNLLYGLSLPVIKTFSATMLSMDVEQQNALPTSPLIIAPNHPSMIDPFIMAAILGRRSYILITDVMFHVPVMGAYLRTLGHIPVAPQKGQTAIDAALEHLRDGHTVMIFPEGMNSPVQGGFARERTGVARLALASGATLIPVGIFIERDRLQRLTSVVSGEIKYSNWYLRGPYSITMGDPLHFTGDPQDRDLTKEVAHQIMLKIMRLAAESQQRWYRDHPPVAGELEIP